MFKLKSKGNNIYKNDFIKYNNILYYMGWLERGFKFILVDRVLFDDMLSVR